jgi:ribonucleoside-diphosphate reductase alpha chain
LKSPKLSKQAKKTTYFELNNLLNIPKDGRIQLDKDREAVRAYFLEYVNPNTVFFHTLDEKLDYLVENNYIKKDFLEKYDRKFIKKLFKRVYDKKFRFKSFMGAYKFYSQYALKTNDGERFLERYEDRIAFNALALANGDEQLALDLADELINQRYQPATPTFLNIGKARAGEMVSCFKEDAIIRTIDGYKKIKDVTKLDRVLTHDGTYKKVLGLNKRYSNDDIVTLNVVGQEKSLSATIEHPVLIYRPNIKNNKNKIKPILTGDGDTHNLKWLKIEDVIKGDYVSVSFEKFNQNEGKEINIFDYLSDDIKKHLFINEEGMICFKTIDYKNNKKKGYEYSKKSNKVKNKIIINEEFGRMLGYYISEGYIHRENGEIKGVKFTFATKEKDYIEDVMNISKEIFGVDCVKNNNKDNSTNVCIWSKIIGDFFNNIIGSGFDKKIITNDFLKNTTRSFMKGVIIGAFRGDGCTSTNSIILEMTNPNMVKQIRDFAFNIGILTYYKRNRTQSGKYSGRLSIPIINYDNEKFVREINKDIYKIKHNIIYSSANAMWIDGYPVYKVKSISREKNSGFVYNLEVEDNHTYSAEGFIVHNCFLITVSDDMNSIGRSVNSSLQLSKIGGGVGRL